MQVITDSQSKAILEPPAPDRSSPLPQASGNSPGAWVVHPFLLATYPIVALLGQNAREVRLASVCGLLGLVLVASVAIWLLFRVVLRDGRKAGAVTSLIIVLFFTIDIVAHASEVVLTKLSQYWVINQISLPLGVVVACEAGLVAWATYYLMSKVADAGRLTRFLNLFAILLIAIPVSQVALAKTPTAVRPPRAAEPYPLAVTPKPKRLPDIYYIILDGYARSDVMKSLFDFDNTPFLDRLRKQGFYVAEQSIANYCQTPLSLSASLNAVYLDDLVKGLGPDQTELSDLIGKNNLMASLKPLGYRFATFATGFDPTEHPEADLYLSPHPFASGFERMVLDITPLHRIWPDPKQLNPIAMSRERTFFLLDHLPDTANGDKPTFTLAHVFCPHPPIIFGENGEDVRFRYLIYNLQGGPKVAGRFPNPQEFAKGYRDQSAFITGRIERTIEQILARSTEPPIIILQSDHGSELNLDVNDVKNTDVKERMSILNAYYFPDQKYSGLYPGISPVNSFRVVLNTFFGAKLPMLPDRSFFSTWSEPYQFIDVTESVRAPRSLSVSVNKP